MAKNVVDTVNAVVGQLKTELINAKARKDREAVDNLTNAVKSLNGIRKPIDKLARAKPPRKRINIDASTNGFLRPVHISPELAKFLGCPEDELKSRVQVTQAIWKYIKDHNLQTPTNGRVVIVDDTLSKLLNVDPETQGNLAYCKIQSCIKHHFIKPSAESVA